MPKIDYFQVYIKAYNSNKKTSITEVFYWSSTLDAPVSQYCFSPHLLPLW